MAGANRRFRRANVGVLGRSGRCWRLVRVGISVRTQIAQSWAASLSRCRPTMRSKTDARKRGCARLLTPFNANVRRHRLMFKPIACVVLLALPVAAWAFIKPVRVLAPEFAGVQCHGKICVDDPTHLTEATTLYDEAVRFVQLNVGELQTKPRAVFCSTQACSQSFGSRSRVAYNVGTFAVVISHRGWKPYFVRHELIHHLQSEHLGSLRNWLFKPDWFREGMAYSMSEDPRRPLPEPLQGYRSQFENWFQRVGKSRLWSEAEHL